MKDWKRETIQDIDRNSFKLRTNRGLVREKNPLMQARVYALEVATTLQADPALRQSADSLHAGKLCRPYGYGVVLTKISRELFNGARLGDVIEPSKVICKDELDSITDAEAFQERLWGMFQRVFSCAVTLPQIDRIRHHLFLEIRLAAGANRFGLFADGRLRRG